MKKLFTIVLSSLIGFGMFATDASAATTHTVISGDSMWKIAVKYEVGLNEIKRANPQLSDPDLIYPGQVLVIPITDSSVLSYEKEVIRLVNEIRVKNGLKALTYNRELSRVARYKSHDMKDNSYFSHTSPVYGTPFQMIKAFGITWMNSAGHRANILSASFTQIGVGYVADGNYWTQMFIAEESRTNTAVTYGFSA